MPRAHVKSRRGCRQCKARRVKCDESMPSCRNCTRLSQQCSLVWITPSSTMSKSKSLSAPVLSGSELIAPSGYNPASTIFDLSCMDFDSLDLELFCLYTSSTHSLLASTKSSSIWRVEIPQLALAHPYLMHSLLAVSALHLAHLDARRHHQLVARAASHESIALPYFRKTTYGITELNCHAVFAFSGFVTWYALASHGRSEMQYTTSSKDGGLPNWFHLLRGSHALYHTFRKWLINGMFAPLLKMKNIDIQFPRNPQDVYLAALLPLFSPQTPVSKEEEEALAICETALDELRRVWASSYSACQTVDLNMAIRIWPGTISPQYIQLLRENRPEALVILAHYCAMLNEVRDCWYLEGLAPQILATIRLSLSEEWRAWIQWPCDQVDMNRSIDHVL